MKSIKHYVFASTLITAVLVVIAVYVISAHSYNTLLFSFADKTSNILLEQKLNALWIGMEQGSTRDVQGFLNGDFEQES